MADNGNEEDRNGYIINRTRFAADFHNRNEDLSEWEEMRGIEWDLILHSDGGQLYTQLVTRSRLQYEIPCKFLLEAQYGQVKVGENFDVTVSSRNHTFGMRIDQPADNGAIKITAYIDF
ncbi:MATH domain-containing protein [Caenorhabditis elegans]|uniref:MATH domain-containing protein n=1 Tax=Caenorhabditis elegans TaxID=6239 RepID=Q9NEQ5_CAEEL|nr:MATH domain-containing protein [Caenorhabditis elegans]CAB60960.1 MATH domain-containing protein [Caenorhabditis elegans]|eukprot:NP_507531.1 Uncharacterized protein CELE_Y59A8B.12 [Caenorhabditis elegans]